MVTSTIISDELYEQCQPILRDDALDEDDKTDKLEELLRSQAGLSGRSLNDAVLNVLWRHRDATNPAPAVLGTSLSASSGGASSSPRPAFRYASPRPWQGNTSSSSTSHTTPSGSPAFLGASIALHSTAGANPPFNRVRSAIGASHSPFGSPRPSPCLAFATPIPHSPSLSRYEFTHDPPKSNAASTKIRLDDDSSNAVDWLVADDVAPKSRPTSSGAASAFGSTTSSSLDPASSGTTITTPSGNTSGSTLSAAAPAWVQPQQAEMSPFDMLRSILGESRSDDEIEYALEAHSYDLSATLATLMTSQGTHLQDPSSISTAGADGSILIGKSMRPSPAVSNSGSPRQTKSNIICKYWMATGNCLRADCRFSHEYGTTICRYWLMGNCLAGDTCVFSHDPAYLVSNLSLNSDPDGNAVAASQQASLQVQDHDAFPSLSDGPLQTWASTNVNGYRHSQFSMREGSHGRSLGHFESSPRSYGSRPSSRHSSRAVTPSIPAVEDGEAFPTLGVEGPIKGNKKHRGQRGHGHSHGKENLPSSLADVVRMAPAAPDSSPSLLRKGLTISRTGNSAAAAAISAPEHIPWLETGDRMNQAYVKARQEAFKHGGLRNKFLQSAAQAWNRNDARAAKALSLRGQSENELMRKAHREAARLLYEDRNAQDGSSSSELYVDLHGLHPEEAVSYLAQALSTHRKSPRPIYAITGTGHHSKGGKDKVGKAVRAWLAEARYAFREFSVPGDRGNVGGILGIDARTGSPEAVDASLEDDAADMGLGGLTDAGNRDDQSGGTSTKIRILKHSDNLPALPSGAA